MKIEQTLTLDLYDETQCPVIRAKQGDASTRFLRICMTCGGEPYAMPEGASAHFRCLKRDGHSCLNPAVINDDGSVTVELTDQVLAVPGMVWADVCLMGADGAMLSTLSFQIRVDFAPVGLSAASGDEVLTLLELIKQAGMLEGGASAYEIARQYGFEGTEEEWLASLKGADGEPGVPGEPGEAGVAGADGYTPVKGVDYFTEEEQQALRQDVMQELPVTEAEDGYTDITGLRKVTSISMQRTDEYITVVATLEGGKADSTVCLLDENGYPVKIVSGDDVCELTWDGFEQPVLEGWEGGSY